METKHNNVRAKLRRKILVKTSFHSTDAKEMSNTKKSTL